MNRLSATQLPPEEERFAKNAAIMAEAVYESVLILYNAGYKTVDPGMIKLVTAVISGFDKHFLIKGFIENSHEKCWDNIRNRSEVFFVEQAADIFKYLPVDKVNLFKDLFTTVDNSGHSVVSQNLKDQLWDLFDVMVKISIKYVHKNRKPYNDGVKNLYREEFFKDVNIPYHSNAWEVQLEFPIC
jgi:hypothetical protein